MQQQWLSPDVITHSAVISAYEKGAKPERALELFDAIIITIIIIIVIAIIIIIIIIAIAIAIINKDGDS